ncbi:hypothetical protein BDZ94DRAFT_1250571 [Collybia nuda]|uniref:Uncharacterized protein n=1 Tax=Collybia nuda TaxID=64659 RepID=A0A9P5YDW4_9AGAR|nr:hypothetical protein BDZ94DRAFT_1250571 [Collybia nuda]
MKLGSLYFWWSIVVKRPCPRPPRSPCSMALRDISRSRYHYGAQTGHTRERSWSPERLLARHEAYADQLLNRDQLSCGFHTSVAFFPAGYRRTEMKFNTTT